MKDTATFTGIARYLVLLSFGSFFLLTGCASTPHRPLQASSPTLPQTDAPMTGFASYYSKKYHGKRTASGEIYDMYKMTAAHRTLPFGVRVRVTELSGNRSVVVRINDRGPFVRGRIIDLSLAAARGLGIVEAGQARVRVEIIPQMTSAAGQSPDVR